MNGISKSVSPSIIRLEGVCKSYRKNGPRALEQTNLDVRAGEFLSLLGPSGSGKTTMLRLIAGFETPDVGKIYLNGADITQLPANRRDINTVFQNFALFPHLTVAQNVAYPLDVKYIKHDRRVTETIALVEMSGFETRLPHELSGGQRQRVALARALIGRPKVLLLDEPLGALDLRLRQQMQSALTRLQRETQITFIYVTHDHGEALSMSDRIAVMSHGRIRQVDTPHQIYHRPIDRFVAGFIGNTNLIEGVVEPDGHTFCNEDIRLKLRRRSMPGSSVASVRFESIKIVTVEHQVPNHSSFDAEVRQVTFRGDGVELRLLIGLTELSACIHDRSALAFKPGDRLAISVDDDDIVVLYE